jgi:hypothetical protein
LREAATDRELASGIFNTLVLIWLDCWDGKSFRWSQATTIPALAEAWDIHRGTAWRHIQRLEEFGWVEINYITPTIVRLRPSANALNLPAGRDGATHGRATAPGGGESISNELLIIEEEKTPSVAEPRRRASATDNENFEKAVQVLRDAGAYYNVAIKVANITTDMNYIRSWLKYIELDKEHGIAFAVRRMIDGDPVPEFCELCGGVNGDHGWIMTELQGFIPCPLEVYDLSESDIEKEYGQITIL